MGHQGLLVPAASASPLVVGSAKNTSSTSSSATTSTSINCAVGDVIYVCVGAQSSSSSTPTISSSISETYTAILTGTGNQDTWNPAPTFGTEKLFVARAVVGTAGSRTFTVNDTGAGFPSLCVVVYRNVVHESITAVSGHDSATTFDSPSITTNNNSGWLVFFIMSGQNANPTYGMSGATIDVAQQDNSLWTCAIAHKAFSGTTTDHAAFTTAQSPCDAIVAACVARQAP